MSETFYNARNLNIENGFVRNPNRYYLEEFFEQLPKLNTILSGGGFSAAATAANKNFMLVGTDASSEFNNSRTTSGIRIKTDNTVINSISIIEPHSDAGQTAWFNTYFGTNSSIEWSCAVSIVDITNVKFWCGLKVSNTNDYSIDLNQAFFKFHTSLTGTTETAFNEFSKLHFIYSISGIDYVSQLPITVAADTVYRLRILIDSNRKISIFVNDIQYNINNTSTITAVTNGTSKSLSLTTNVSLKPYISLQTEAAAEKSLDVYYQKISRNLL